ncbi:uncharacterized protein LOC127707351 [Mytilus californianus]|uniref:uncharacterized protein LOC127707351 n=1 Tax=Mytilus californianus TaxID=6549 RepID=UPI002245C064|nr:uncharacterized protein LOC127707351 [Mytilus californianus]
MEATSLDASSFALQYKDPKAMASFNVKAWLKRRNRLQNLNDAYSSITTTENKSTGQDFDFILEEKNRQLKSWIPKGIPTDSIWQTVCRNNLILEKIKHNSLSLFAIQTEKDTTVTTDAATELLMEKESEVDIDHCVDDSVLPLETQTDEIMEKVTKIGPSFDPFVIK